MQRPLFCAILKMLVEHLGVSCSPFKETGRTYSIQVTEKLLRLFFSQVDLDFELPQLNPVYFLRRIMGFDL